MFRRTLLPAVLLGLSLLQAAVVGASVAEPGLWQAAWALGAEQEVGPRGDLVAGWLTALSHGIDVDPETAAWLEDLRDGMLELDLQRTWSRLPEQVGDERRVHVAGRNQGSRGYALKLDGKGLPARHHWGDLDGMAGLRPQPWDGATAYSSEGRLALTTHPIGQVEARSVAQALLLALEDAARDTSGPATDAAIRARVRADFPATATVLDRLVTFERWGRRLADDVLLIDISVRIDADRMASSGLPALAKFVRRMGDVADLSLTVRSRHGELGSIWAKSPGNYGIRFATKAGALVPLSNTTPVLDHALDITTLSSADLALRPRGIIRLKGTRLAVDHWTVPLTWRVNGDRADLRSNVSTLPSVDFRSDGGMTGWMVATAGNAVGLESQALRFFESVAEGTDGPGGQGSIAAISMQPTGGHWTLDGRWDIRMLDNLVVRFAAQVLGHRIVPDDAVLDDLLQIEGAVVAALAEDWHTARPLVVALRPTQGDEVVPAPSAPPDDGSSGSR